jgi:3-oxoacyl-[acyl-carrier protein] reductase
MINSKLKRLTNKVCLVTGAGRGIGRNIAVALGREGCALALADIDATRLSLVQSELLSQGIVAEIFVSDLSLKGGAHTLVKAVVEKFGKIELMINSARSGRRLTFLDESEENWDLTLDVNLKANFFLVQAAISYMPKGSSIINIGSVSGQFVSNESPSYQISKAGLVHLTRYLAVNSGGVRVNSVLPGYIVQDEHRHRYELDDAIQEKYRSIVQALHPMGGGPGYSDDIADAVIFLASNESRFITGQSLVVDGGLTIQDPTKILFDQMWDGHEA